MRRSRSRSRSPISARKKLRKGKRDRSHSRERVGRGNELSEYSGKEIIRNECAHCDQEMDSSICFSRTIRAFDDIILCEDCLEKTLSKIDEPYFKIDHCCECLRNLTSDEQDKVEFGEAVCDKCCSIGLFSHKPQ